MPRLALFDAPGVLHYVMICGIERRKICRENKDRRSEDRSQISEVGQQNRGMNGKGYEGVR